MQLILRNLFLLLAVVLGRGSLLPAAAQSESSSVISRTDAPTDTSYVRLFPSTFTARIYLSEKFAIFDLIDRAGNHKIEYRPNAILALGLGVTVRGVGLNFSTRLPFHDTKEDRFGVTRRYDIQVHRYRRKLAFDLYLQRYKGFHLTDSNLVSQIIGPTEYPYFPNLRQLRFGATVLFAPGGNNYSMRAALNQQEWQLRSAGSLLVGGSLHTQFIHNEGANVLPPFYVHPEAFGGRAIIEIQNYSLTLNAGGGYNLVFPGQQNWFVGGALDVGAGPAYSRVKDLDDSWESSVVLNLSANLRLQGGYNSEKWFAGLYGIVHADRYGLPMDKTGVVTAQGLARAVVARRFTSFKLGRKKPKPVE